MNTARHWSALGETTFVGGTWFLYGIHRWFGRWPFRVCAWPVVLAWWLASPTARGASRDYLRRLQAAHSVLDREPGVRQSLRHFFAFAETMLDKMLAIAGRMPPGSLVFSGHEPLLADAARGQGAVIATAHMGCLELLQTAAGARVGGLPVTILVHTAHAQRFNAMLARINPASTVRLMQVTDFSPPTAMRLAERVAAGEFVAIAADRVPVQGDRLCRADFLGAPADFPSGPYLLASLLRCPLWMMSCEHEGDGYHARLRPLAARIELPRGRRDEALDAYAQRFAEWLESCVRRSPHDWFNFSPFWERARHARDTD